MTNRDILLKAGINPEEFINNFVLCLEQIVKNINSCNTRELVAYYLNKQVKPTLSEEEKVILRSLAPEINYIGKMKHEDFIYISYEKNYHTWSKFYVKDGLFSFINEGEEFNIKELLEEED